MRSAFPAAQEKAEADYLASPDDRQSASARARLIDTRLVRAELAKLRAPRPGTEVYRAHAIRSTIPGGA